MLFIPLVFQVKITFTVLIVKIDGVNYYTFMGHIIRLGGWESLDMVLRYTRSVKWEESLRLYREMER